MGIKNQILLGTEASSSDLGDAAVVRRGPPNRMNDLSYREWMKFQKSFFRVGEITSLVREHINFFTKQKWDDGSFSSSLLAVESELEQFGDRILHRAAPPTTGDEAVELFANTDQLDYALIDLRHVVTDEKSLQSFSDLYAERFFAKLRASLRPGRYCTIIVESDEPGRGGFPLPWSLGMLGRTALKLRDEKVGIYESHEKLLYCLNFQAEDDARCATWLSPDSIQHVVENVVVPAWVIPKPPPRKANEILHPAKYPETLVEGFIEIYTKKGELVFDPMVGTGSTLIAALRKQRNAAGTDLSAEFVEISRSRIRDERMPTLFEEATFVADVYEADATHLDSVPELQKDSFDYAITSPPYWSMLANKGSENQEKRRSRGLKIVYSDDKRDLGNVSDYDAFIDLLENVYGQVAGLLRSGAHLTIVVKNVKREHTLFPLAWDLVARLAKPGSPYEYTGYTLWCQDDVSVKPFAVGIHWVSNILHTYCLHLKRR